MKRILLLISLLILLVAPLARAEDPIQLEEICEARAEAYIIECYILTNDAEMCSQIGAMIFADCMGHQ